MNTRPPGRSPDVRKPHREGFSTDSDDETLSTETGESEALTLTSLARRVACHRPHCHDVSPKKVLRSSGCCSSICFIFLALLVFQGWVLVSKSMNMDSWHDPNVPPPEFPRYMGCGACLPGNKTNAEIQECAEPCFGLDLVLSWEALASKLSYAAVHFPSRAGPAGEPPVDISAWWLPSDPQKADPRTAPRIIVLHGLGSNSNHCGVQSACFLLRSIGFSCLTPTVRDYGLSGPSTHPSIMTWGYDYQADLLGAWDYAVNDPDGVLGGPLPPSKVGVMGFSKGAYATAIAFLLEKRIPAAWIDSAPVGGLKFMITSKLQPWLGILAPVVAWPVWKAAEYFSGGRLDIYDMPQLILNCTSPKRFLAIAQGMMDTTVPLTCGISSIVFIGGLEECYDMTTYTPPVVCDGATHHAEMFQYPDDTREKLCKFWSGSFHQHPSRCGLADLPQLQKVRAADMYRKYFYSGH